MIRRIALAASAPLGCFTLALLCAPSHAHAHDGTRWEIMAGRSHTLDSLWTNAAFVERLGDEHALGPLTWAPDLGLGFIQARSTARARLDHDVGLLALGARVQLWRGLFVSEQAALALGRTDAVSSGCEFVSSLGWQGPRWVLMLRHISNAELHKPNHGETMLLLGAAF